MVADIHLPENSQEKLGESPALRAQGGRGKGWSWPADPHQATPPPHRAIASTLPGCTKPRRSFGICTHRIGASRSLWKGEWLPLPRLTPDRGSCGLPGGFLSLSCIRHPCSVAGSQPPGGQGWVSDPRCGRHPAAHRGWCQSAHQSNLTFSIQFSFGCLNKYL